MLKAGLFDIDGVILDSELLYYKAVCESFEPYGVDISLEEFTAGWVLGKTCSMGIIKKYDLAQKYRKSADVILEDVRQGRRPIHKRLVSEELQLMPGIERVLYQVFDGYPLGVVTASSKDEYKRGLGKFNLLERFAVQVSDGDYENNKPHPDPYLVGLDGLRAVEGLDLKDLKADEVVVFEDNPSGVVAAKRAGCKVIAFPNGITKSLVFEKDSYDDMIYSLDEINMDRLQRLYAA